MKWFMIIPKECLTAKVIFFHNKIFINNSGFCYQYLCTYKVYLIQPDRYEKNLKVFISNI